MTSSPKAWSKSKNLREAAMNQLRQLAPAVCAKDDAARAEFYQEQQSQAQAQQLSLVTEVTLDSLSSNAPQMLPQQQAMGTTAMTPELVPVQPIVPLWSVKDAQSDRLTVAGAANRFIFVRYLQGKPRVVDLQNINGVPISLPDFRLACADKVDIGNGNLRKVCDLLEDEVVNRTSQSVGGQNALANRFTIVDDMLFDPTLPKGKTVTASGREIYNLYLGLDCEQFAKIDDPKQHCQLIIKYVNVVLGHPDTDPGFYIFKWMAYCVQNIGEKSGVAVVLRGIKGAGKTTLNRLMYGLLSPHAFITDKASDIAGQFNGHLADMLYVGCDEALWAESGQNADRVKALITDRTMAMEAKYKQSGQHMTYMNISFTSNHDQAAPATGDERRYAVFDLLIKGLLTPDEWKQLHTLDLQPGSVALGAFFQVLKNYDLQGWVPRDNIPQNAALASVKAENLSGTIGAMTQWILECEQFPGSAPGADWDAGPIVIMGAAQRECVRNKIHDWHKYLRPMDKKGKLKSLPGDRTIALALKNQFGALVGDDGPRGGNRGMEKGWEIPDRATCERNWKQANGL
jgi:hypothetical protein